MYKTEAEYRQDIVEVGKSKKSVFDIMLDIATGSIRNVANTAVRF